MTTLPTTEQVLTWIGLPVHDDAGTHVGSCQNVYADDDSQLPEWVEVALTSDGVAFVPTLGATSRAGVLRLAHPAAVIAASPRYPSDSCLSAADERALYDHYGVASSGARSDSLLPAAADRPGDASVIPTLSTVPDRKRRGGAALLLAVPAALLLARRRGVLPRVALRRQPSTVRRRGPGAAALLAPLVAGAGAQLLQRRRTQTPVTPGVVPPLDVVQPPEVVDRATHTPV